MVVLLIVENNGTMEWILIYELNAASKHRPSSMNATHGNSVSNINGSIIYSQLSPTQPLQRNYNFWCIWIMAHNTEKKSSLTTFLTGQHGISGIRWWRKCWCRNYGCWSTILSVGPDDHPLQLLFDPKFYVLCYFFFQYVTLRFTWSK